MKKITIVGCGLGSAEYMTKAGVDAIINADVLIGAAPYLEIVKNKNAKKIETGADVQKAIKSVTDNIQNGSVALLVSGDPGIFSMARLIIKEFGRDICRVIPGISSVQAAFAMVCLNWDDALILSAHAANPDVDIAQAKKHNKIAILGGRDESSKWAHRFAVALEGERSVFICENLGRDNERFTEISLDDLLTINVVSRTVILLINKELIK
ncbi:Cobalt-precorrin-6y C5-methyltransferase [hydrothermal vent metagenome]|uniref:Cobalt-precorrin-6y C5-methyltransferase n=1 Tax=hydrothermal vent metagenome TaxID=652676 RepID=A0A3B1CG92_9ZZZZ